MTNQEVFIKSNQAINNVVQQIADDQWDMEIPEWFQVGATQPRPITLRTIINYHALDDAWVPDVLAGKTAEEVGDKYDGDLLGDDPKASFAAINAKSNAAVRALDDPKRMVHLSYGDFPAGEYLQHITFFRTFRAYDIAKLIGADTKLPDDLVQGLWDILVVQVEQWRAMGVFGPAVGVAEDAPLQDRLLGMVGRDPKPLT